MYCSHFGLHRLPFNNTPDPTFYFSTPEHEEALASLQYATQQRKGFVLVTGEVGAGKTLIGRMFLRQIDEQATTAVITNTNLTGRQLLAALCAEFALDVPRDASNLELTYRLQDYLLDQFARDRYVVVLLDEGQNLPDESFEELRMLGNLEADDAKLLQVCILGQPELRDRFKRSSMRQLDQRLFSRFHLPSLSREQVGQYIRHRLVVAGHSGEGLFTEEAVAAIWSASRGIPRVINQTCDNALLTCYGKNLHAVDEHVIEMVLDRDPSLRVEARNAQVAAEVGSAGSAAGSTSSAVALADPVSAHDRIEQRIESIYGSRPRITNLLEETPRMDSRFSSGGRLPEAVREPIRHRGGDFAPDVARDVSGPEMDVRQELRRTLDNAASRWLICQQRVSGDARGMYREVKTVAQTCRSVQAELDRITFNGPEGGIVESMRRLHRRRIKRLLSLMQGHQKAFKRVLRESQTHWLRTREELAARADEPIGYSEIDQLRRQLDETISSSFSRMDRHLRRIAHLIGKARGQCDATLNRLVAMQAQQSHAQSRLIDDLAGQLARHADRLATIDHKIDTQMGVTAEKIVAIEQHAAGAEDLARIRAEHGRALAEIVQRYEEASGELRHIRQEIRAHIDQTPDQLRSAMSDLDERVNVHDRQLQELRQKLLASHAGALDRITQMAEKFAAREDVEKLRHTQLEQTRELLGRIEESQAQLRTEIVRRGELDQRAEAQQREIIQVREQLSRDRQMALEQFAGRELVEQVRRQQAGQLQEVLNEIEQERRQRKSLVEQFAERAELEAFKQTHMAQVAEILGQIDQERSESRTLREQFVERAELQRLEQEQIARVGAILDEIEKERQERNVLAGYAASRSELEELQHTHEVRISELAERMEQERLHNEAAFACRSRLEEVCQEQRQQVDLVLSRIEQDRVRMQGLIDGLVDRCKATQEQLDLLAATHAQGADELSALRARQQEGIAELLGQIEQQRDRTRAELDCLIESWRRTQASVDHLGNTAADISTVEALRARQIEDNERLQQVLTVQRQELAGLVDKVGRRLDEMIERVDALPKDIATTDHVNAVREDTARQLGGLLSRLDRENAEHQNDIADMNRRWQALADSFESLSAKTLPTEEFRAAEQSIARDLTRLSGRLSEVTQTHQQCLRTVIESVQQMSSRLRSLERRRPVQVAVKPRVAEQLEQMLAAVRGEREQFAALLDQGRSVLSQVNEAGVRVEQALKGWREQAVEIHEQSESLKASAAAAAEVMQAMKRSVAAVDAKLKSPQWQRELDRGAGLAGQLVEAARTADATFQKLTSAIQQAERSKDATFEHLERCREQEENWTQHRSEAQQCTERLTRILLTANRVVEDRHRRLADVTRRIAGLSAEIEAARSIDEEQAAPAETDNAAEARWASPRNLVAKAS